jgi:ATP-binding protein involved in chromosome partitioning
LTHYKNIMQNQLSLPKINKTLVIASGKGGVGKTTVTVNLALALQRTGLRVGIFDADIYGPNVPLMLGIHQSRRSQGYVPIVRRKGALPYIPPVERFGLKLMSVGLIIGEQQVINPLPDEVGRLVVQTLQDVLWEELDCLLIDLPPSAGQPQTDLVRRVKLDGVIIVTTPQDLSLLDASRSLLMFQQANVPVLGIVENMSYFICPNCQEKHEIFQQSKQWQPPALANAPLLGRIPLTAEISRSINQSDPLMHENPTGVQAQAFMEIVAALRERLGSKE